MKYEFICSYSAKICKKYAKNICKYMQNGLNMQKYAKKNCNKICKLFRSPCFAYFALLYIYSQLSWCCRAGFPWVRHVTVTVTVWVTVNSSLKSRALASLRLRLSHCAISKSTFNYSYLCLITPPGIINNNDSYKLIIPNYSFNYSFNYSLNCFLRFQLFLIIPLIILNYSCSYPQHACQFLVVVWCTFYVLNCPDGVQARKWRTMSNHSRLFPWITFCPAMETQSR